MLAYAVLVPFAVVGYRPRISDASEKLTPADPHHFQAWLAHALTSDGRLARMQSAELLATIVAERIATRLEKDGFVIMQKPPAPGDRGYSMSGR